MFFPHIFHDQIFDSPAKPVKLYLNFVCIDFLQKHTTAYYRKANYKNVPRKYVCSFYIRLRVPRLQLFYETLLLLLKLQNNKNKKIKL